MHRISKIWMGSLYVMLIKPRNLNMQRLQQEILVCLQNLNVGLHCSPNCVSDCPLCPHMNGRWQWRHSKAPPATLIYFELVDVLLAAVDRVTSAVTVAMRTPWKWLLWWPDNRSLWESCGWKWLHPNQTHPGTRPPTFRPGVCVIVSFHEKKKNCNLHLSF